MLKILLISPNYIFVLISEPGPQIVYKKKATGKSAEWAYASLCYSPTGDHVYGKKQKTFFPGYYTTYFPNTFVLLLLLKLPQKLSAPSSSSASLMALLTESFISFILAGSSEGSAFNSSVSICFILFVTFS